MHGAVFNSRNLGETCAPSTPAGAGWMGSQRRPLLMPPPPPPPELERDALPIGGAEERGAGAAARGAGALARGAGAAALGAGADALGAGADARGAGADETARGADAAEGPERDGIAGALERVSLLRRGADGAGAGRLTGVGVGIAAPRGVGMAAPRAEGMAAPEGVATGTALGVSIGPELEVPARADCCWYWRVSFPAAPGVARIADCRSEFTGAGWSGDRD